MSSFEATFSPPSIGITATRHCLPYPHPFTTNANAQQFASQLARPENRTGRAYPQSTGRFGKTLKRRRKNVERRRVICLLIVCLPFAAPLSASAKESSVAALKSGYEASRNMHGLIKFCIKSGYLGTESDGHISALVKMTDTPDVDKSGGNAAEAKGLAGRLVLDGNKVELASRPLGAEEWCKQTGEALKSQADQLPQ